MIPVKMRLTRQFIEKYEKEHPSLVKAFKRDIEALLFHLKFPVAHRKAIRPTNLIERSFEEDTATSVAYPREAKNGRRKGGSP